MRYLDHLELSYCTNVHAGEGLSAILNQINHDIPLVKALVSPNKPFGSGLRVGYETVRELSEHTHALTKLKQALLEQDIYVFSVNGFPYGDFAAPQVKATVYDPDWSTDERVDYTLRLARLMTALPGPKLRSISTVAGGFVPNLRLLKSKDHLFAKNFARLAQGLAELEDETGISVRIALEPEPWTRLERTDQVLPFFEDVVWPASKHAQKYIGLCYDTCHQALAFEDPIASWNQLTQQNIPIYKVQISNALRLSKPQDAQARQRLFSFAEQRYLHQVTALTADGTVLRALDLPDLFQTNDQWLNALEWRCHFHVPIWWQGQEAQANTALSTETMISAHDEEPPKDPLGLGTTYLHWQKIAHCMQNPLAQKHTREGAQLHVEVETYSWHVLPDALKSQLGLHHEISEELFALQSALRTNQS